ncbi:hypothetical protein S83_022333, partial [Arachis hypogaea]
VLSSFSSLHGSIFTLLKPFCAVVSSSAKSLPTSVVVTAAMPGFDSPNWGGRPSTAMSSGGPIPLFHSMTLAYCSATL